MTNGMNEEHARFLESDKPAAITEGATMLDIRSWCYKSGYRAAIEDLCAGHTQLPDDAPMVLMPRIQESYND